MRYSLTNLKRHSTKYGERIMVELDNLKKLFLPERYNSFSDQQLVEMGGGKLIPTFSSPHHVTTPPNAQPRFKSPPQVPPFSPQKQRPHPPDAPTTPKHHPFHTKNTNNTPSNAPTNNQLRHGNAHNAIGPPLMMDTPTIPTTRVPTTLSVPKVSQKGLTVEWWKEEPHSSDTAGFESQAGWASHRCLCLYSCCGVQKNEKGEERVSIIVDIGQTEIHIGWRRFTHNIHKKLMFGVASLVAIL
ncbi:hypothetical protein GEV33_007082 [Tenebrio molitor]|uniref:Uncharacterized protein n=1 Tax=Tenebrio molitor TaxID=7067 RepID=A0A8J6LBF7_TENMO|nr:hypothetical protein GEV33_007082 [Tenebrio molitor]